MKKKDIFGCSVLYTSKYVLYLIMVNVIFGAYIGRVSYHWSRTIIEVMELPARFVLRKNDPKQSFKVFRMRKRWQFSCVDLRILFAMTICTILFIAVSSCSVSFSMAWLSNHVTGQKDSLYFLNAHNFFNRSNEAKKNYIAARQEEELALATELSNESSIPQSSWRRFY